MASSLVDYKDCGPAIPSVVPEHPPREGRPAPVYLGAELGPVLCSQLRAQVCCGEVRP